MVHDVVEDRGNLVNRDERQHQSPDPDVQFRVHHHAASKCHSLVLRFVSQLVDVREQGLAIVEMAVVQDCSWED